MKADITGQIFGKWTVKRFARRKGTKYYWTAQCACETTRDVLQHSLVSGASTSCGCTPWRTHGMTGTRFYNIWRKIMERCTNPNHVHYQRYGGSGVIVEWAAFENFKKDMYAAYRNHCRKHGTQNTSIDRIDSSGNYSKANCRWQHVRDKRRTDVTTCTSRFVVAVLHKPNGRILQV